MKYAYEIHEQRYRALHDAARPVTFDGSDFDRFDLRPVLAHVLEVFPLPEGARIFLYGAGTGPAACHLAERGFRVDAIDVSPAAIDLARRFAARRGVEPHFEVADVCDLDWPEAGYDAVIDDFALHCIVSDAERRRAFANVRGLLAPDGLYLVACPVWLPEREYGNDERLDAETGVVHCRANSLREDSPERVRIDGDWWIPCRRHQRPEALRREIERAGFRVAWQDGGRLVAHPA